MAQILPMYYAKVNYQMTALLVGTLGKSAEISLTSMLLNYKNICLGVDEHGKASIIKFAKSQKIEIDKCLCFHPISSEKLQQLNLEVFNTFSNFGESNFVKLTTFKWYLLQEVMNKHSDKDHIIFSDLDVFWKNQIRNLPVDEKVLVYAQNDTPLNSNKPHFCTGIMIWKNHQENKQILNKLYEKQLQNINQNILIPDEPIFNDYFSHDTSKVFPLSDNEYLIGHKFFSIPWKIAEIIAFHANYVTGDIRKHNRLKTIYFLANQKSSYLVYYVIELLVKIISKIRNK